MPRFQLRTALLVMLVIGVILGCAGRYWRARQRDAAVAMQARVIARAFMWDWDGAVPRSPFPSELSWRVHLLPNLGEDELYRKFHLSEPWDSPHNLPLVSEMPAVFRAIDSLAPVGWTTFKIFEFDGDSWPTLCETDDAHAAPWTRPDPSEPETGSRPSPLIGLHRGSG